jgi:DNA-binding transcriptional LysR family regulator
MRRSEVADLTAFVAVADHLSFRAAAAQLRVTPSALSHTMRLLEERLGTRLLNRTTRSVSLTAAGNRLLQRLHPAFNQISTALEDLDRERGRPSGLLRLAIAPTAFAAIAQFWGRFLSTYPEIELELQVEAEPVDIVSKGFDAGIRLRARIPADMIAVRIIEPFKVAVVGSPHYLALHRPPRTPDDLAAHSCIQYRLSVDAPLFKWPLKRDSRCRNVAVNGRVIVNNGDLALRAAVDGLGLAYTNEALALPFLRTGQLVQVLDDWSPMLEGLFLYYPGHRQVTPALRAFIDTFQATRGQATRGQATRGTVPAKNLLQNPFLMSAAEATRSPRRKARTRSIRSKSRSSRA